MLPTKRLKEIPKRAKSKKYPFDTMNVRDYFEAGEYSTKNAMQTGSMVGYYNRTRKPKKFTQRKQGNQLIVIREL